MKIVGTVQSGVAHGRHNGTAGSGLQVRAGQIVPGYADSLIHCVEAL